MLKDSEKDCHKRSKVHNSAYFNKQPIGVSDPDPLFGEDSCPGYESALKILQILIWIQDLRHQKEVCFKKHSYLRKCQVRCGKVIVGHNGS